MFLNLFNRWSRSSGFTLAEMQVLEELIPPSSLHSFNLLEQARQAPEVVRRKEGAAGYRATIPYLRSDAFLIETDLTIESTVLEIEDAATGRRLQFSTGILPGGFLRGLSGTAADGRRWPEKWSVREGSVRRSSDSKAWLDGIRTEADHRTARIELAQWCGIELLRLTDDPNLRLRAPASYDEIAACEVRLGSRLPEAYRDLVAITNGLSVQRIRRYEVLGVEDLDYLDDARQWIVLAPLHEDGCVALRNEIGTVSSRCYLLAPREAPGAIGDLKRCIADLTERREPSVWSEMA
jgi:hypothetical protein